MKEKKTRKILKFSLFKSLNPSSLQRKTESENFGNFQVQQLIVTYTWGLIFHD